MISLVISTVVLLALAGIGWLAYGTGAKRGHALAGEVRGMREQLRLAKQRKDEAYRERNMLAALLAATLQHEGLVDPAKPGSKWRLYRGYDAHFKGWGNCLYVEPPQELGIGQLCWHYPDKDAWMVDALGLDAHPTGWDGRPREEKYEAIELFLAGGRP